jgi:tetratricopeptide (TPR) repeat protein
MAKARTTEALQHLSDKPSGCLGPIQGDLLSFAPAEQSRVWLERERKRIRVESHLEYSKEMVAHVPIDWSALEEQWKLAMAAGRDAGMESESRSLAGEIAVGRAEVLFAERTREQRLQDRSDPRGAAERSREALALLERAWEITHDDRVQASLAEHLNQRAVVVANKHRYDEAVDLLIRSLGVNPSGRLTAENLVQVVLAHAIRDLGGDTDEAGQYLLGRMRQIAGLDPKGKHAEVQKCAAQLADKGSTPFFNSSGSAAQEEDWDLAVDRMIWAMRIAPEDATVGQGAYALSVALKEKGDMCSQEAHRRLMESAPKKVLMGISMMELLMGYAKRGGR